MSAPTIETARLVLRRRHPRIEPRHPYADTRCFERIGNDGGYLVDE